MKRETTVKQGLHVLFVSTESPVTVGTGSTRVQSVPLEVVTWFQESTLAEALMDIITANRSTSIVDGRDVEVQAVFDMKLSLN